jgi:hypothetical protein
MRKILSLAMMFLWSASIYAQGIINCANIGPGLNAPITNALTLQPISGSGFFVQIYGGPANALEASLVPLGGVATFLSGVLAGYFNGGLATNAFVLPGNVGTFQAKAWSSGFASYEAALTAGAQGNPNALVGKSLVFQNSTGFDASSPASLNGLLSFSIAPVPEPASVALFGLGTAAFVWHCRRRR